MRDINKMKRDRQAILSQMRALTDEAEKREDKNLTEDEGKRFDELKEQADAAKIEIERAQYLQDEEARKVEFPAVHTGKTSDDSEFRTFGEFLGAARDGGDARLEARQASADNGPSMGFLIPTQFDDQIRQLSGGRTIVRENATVIPAGEQPDAEFEMPVLDQTGGKGVHGGVTVDWVGETEDRHESDAPSINMVKLKPKEVSGYIQITQKALNNITASADLITRLLAGARSSAEEQAFFSGSGVGKPFGAYNSAAPVKISRASAGAISYADTINIFSRMYSGGTNYQWVVNPTSMPSIMSLTDSGGNSVWHPDATVGPAGTLHGMPVRVSDFAPVVGEEGDLMLVDWSYYAIKDGSPISIAFNPYSGMKKRLVDIYAFWNVDGQPWVTEPLMLEDGKTKVSPFVMLEK